MTATGLVLKLMSGLQLVVDGALVDLSKTMAYKGMMYSDVPNLASAFGYTNASWTLKCDLTAEYVCRLLKHMDKHGYAQCTPRVNDPQLTEETGTRLHFRLRAEGAPYAAAAGIEEAVANTPKLCEGSSL